MSQAYTDQDKTIALIGIYQVARQVFDLATTGKTDSLAFETSINSLFCEDPQSTLDVFGGDIANIQLGVSTLLAQMSSDSAVQSRNIEITKYVLNMMILEKKVSESEDTLSKIFRIIESARHNREHFGEFHENIMATLARAYSENISPLSPRIIVNGAHGHLQNPIVANKIRSLLLAGIRAAILWRQVGGSRWGLLWSRKKYLANAQSLYRPNIQETSRFDSSSDDASS
ncbi:MAG: high frequency lysogenization protein HflD [Hydrogenovibrio sp.]|nr:high frequency lysogenization protein HflD [Hydrogenovibrio sp.]